MELSILFVLLMFGAVIAGGRVIDGLGLGTPLTNAGAPSAGTSEVWTLTLDATGGTFKLKFQNQTTAAIAWSSTNSTLLANINAALDAVFGAGNIVATVDSMTSGVGTIFLTFSADFGKLAFDDSLSVADNSLTGTATCTVAETTPGVSATHRGAPKGAKLIDITNGIDYINTGTSIAPTWTKTGTQT